MGEITEKKDRRDIYRALITDPQTAGTFKKYSFTEFESKLLSDEKAATTVGQRMVSKGLVPNMDSFFEQYIKEPAPKPVAAPSRPVQVPTLLQPQQPSGQPSLTQVTGAQAVTPMAPDPQFQPFQFDSQKEIDQAAKSPVFLANKPAIQVLNDRGRMAEENPLTFWKDQDTGKFTVYDKTNAKVVAEFDTMNQAASMVNNAGGRSAANDGLIMPTKEAELGFNEMTPDQQRAAIEGGTGGAAYQAEQAEKKKSLFQKGLESATNFAGGFNRAIAKAPSDIVKTVDILSRKLWEPVLGKTGPSTAGELAQKYEKWLDESDFAKQYIGDATDASLSGSVGSGFGQIATMVGGGMTSRTVGGLLKNAIGKDVMEGFAKNPKLLDKVLSPENAIAFGQVFNSEYEGMKAKGESDDVAFRQALANAALSAPTENLPLANLFDRFEKSVGAPIVQRIMNGLIQGIEEGSQEVLQQTLSNLTNNQFAELETSLKDWSDGLQESRNAGGIVGLILGAISGVKGGRVKGQQPPTQLGGINTIPANPNDPNFEPDNGQPTNTPVQPSVADTGTENLAPTDQGVSGGTVTPQKTQEEIKNRIEQIRGILAYSGAQLQLTGQDPLLKEAAVQLRQELEQLTSQLNQSEQTTEQPASSVTPENTKEGDVIYDADGRKVTVVSFGKSRKGNDIIEVQVEKPSDEQLLKLAQATVWSRNRNYYPYGMTPDFLKDFRTTISDVFEESKHVWNNSSGTITIDLSSATKTPPQSNETAPSTEIIQTETTPAAEEVVPVAEEIVTDEVPLPNQSIPVAADEAGGTVGDVESQLVADESGGPVVEGEPVLAEEVAPAPAEEEVVVKSPKPTFNKGRTATFENIQKKNGKVVVSPNEKPGTYDAMKMTISDDGKYATFEIDPAQVRGFNDIISDFRKVFPFISVKGVPSGRMGDAETVNKGILRKDENGDWVVEKKADVIFYGRNYNQDEPMPVKKPLDFSSTQPNQTQPVKQEAKKETGVAPTKPIQEEKQQPPPRQKEIKIDYKAGVNKPPKFIFNGRVDKNILKKLIEEHSSQRLVYTKDNFMGPIQVLRDLNEQLNDPEIEVLADLLETQSTYHDKADVNIKESFERMAAEKKKKGDEHFKDWDQAMAAMESVRDAAKVMGHSFEYSRLYEAYVKKAFETVADKYLNGSINEQNLLPAGPPIGITETTNVSTKSENVNTSEGTSTESTQSPFAAFDTPKEAGRKARAELKSKVGPEQFKKYEAIHKNAPEILRGLESRGVIRIECP